MASALCQFCKGKGTIPAHKNIFEKDAVNNNLKEESVKSPCKAETDSSSSLSQNIFNKERNENLNNSNNPHQTECPFCKGMGIIDMPSYA